MRPHHVPPLFKASPWSNLLLLSFFLFVSMSGLVCVRMMMMMMGVCVEGRGVRDMEMITINEGLAGVISDFIGQQEMESRWRRSSPLLKPRPSCCSGFLVPNGMNYCSETGSDWFRPGPTFSFLGLWSSQLRMEASSSWTGTGSERTCEIAPWWWTPEQLRNP